MDALNNIQESAQDEIRRGAKTIVAVGNNNTLTNIATAVLNSAENYSSTSIPLCIIPVNTDNNDIAGLLGISDYESACNIILARKIEKIDVGCANNNYFISRAMIDNSGSIIKIDDNYSVEAVGPGMINIFNIVPHNENFVDSVKYGPQDGQLELSISINTPKKLLALSNKQKSTESFFSIKNITLYNENLPLILDGSVNIKCPVEVSVYEKAINLIVGKDRQF
jgi:diacylglycerol kinase family enzyme